MYTKCTNILVPDNQPNIWPGFSTTSKNLGTWTYQAEIEGLSTSLGFYFIDEMALLPSSFLISYTLLKSGTEAWNKYEFLSLWVFFKPNRNSYIEIETALDLTKYLAEEDEIIVWHAVLVNLVTRDLVSDVNNHDIYPLLKVISFLLDGVFFKFLSSSFHILDSVCESGLSQKNSLFVLYIFIFLGMVVYS